jgi:hypothetical protein
MTLFVALGVLSLFYCRYSIRSRTEKRAGVISIKTAVEEEKKEEIKSHQYVSPCVVQRFGRVAMITQSMKNAPAIYEGRKRKSKRKTQIVYLNADGNVNSASEKRQTNRPILNNPSQSFSSHDGGQVPINFDLSSSSGDEKSSGFEKSISDITMPKQSSSVDLSSKYVNMMQEKTPRMARKIRSHKSDLHHILHRREAAPGMNSRLKKDLALGVDLSDCSDDSYPDGFPLSSDGEDMEEVVDCFSLSSDSGNVDDAFSLSSDSDDIKMTKDGGDISDSSGSQDENEHTAVDSSSNDLARKYGDLLQEKTPRLVRKIRSHKPDLHHILQRRREVPGMKSQLKRDLALGVDLSDCSDDSYPDKVGGGMFSLSTDSGRGSVGDSSCDSEIDTDNFSESTVILIEVPSSPTHRIAVKQRIVSELFTKPKQNNLLLQRIQKNHDGIQKVGLKRRAQGIEDSFVLNTRARRTSTLANRARAHSKLQKRIEQRKTTTTNMKDGGVKKDGRVDIESMKLGNNDRSSSFKLFEEKKAMVKNYTAHQSLREHSLEAQRLEAKAALKARVGRRKKKLHATGEF